MSVISGATCVVRTIVDHHVVIGYVGKKKRAQLKGSDVSQPTAHSRSKNTLNSRLISSAFTTYVIVPCFQVADIIPEAISERPQHYLAQVLEV